MRTYTEWVSHWYYYCAPAEVLTANAKQCQYCGGPVDRYEHVFQCRCCYSIGDLFTGIMSPNRQVNQNV